MTKSTAAKNLTDVCEKCGHDFGSHAGTKCPPLPPAKSKTAFEKELEDATGTTAANELATKASENFNREVDAGVRRCWIFTEYEDGSRHRPHAPSDGGVSVPSPHLSPAQARRVAKALLRFAEGKS